MHRYLLALGSNVRHPAFGAPRRVLEAAFGVLEAEGFALEAVSPVIESAPLGPSRRRYANAAALVATREEPTAALRALLAIEESFGRRRTGAAWRARVLDLDIVLWDGGAFAEDDGETSLVLPHPAYRTRAFVLAPATRIAGSWRDPLTGLTLRQQSARLTKPRKAPR